MNNALIVHLNCGPAGLDWAKAAGTALKAVPDLSVSQGTLTIPDSLTLSAYLFTTVPYWPDGSVFVSTIPAPEGFVTDADQLIIVRLKNDSLIVSPNNGTATLCAANMGIKEAWRIDPSLFGKDEFALIRCAAKLAAGLSPEEAGEVLPVSNVWLFDIPAASISEGCAEGHVFMLLKTFGNLTFTISIDDFEKAGFTTGDRLKVTFTRHGKVEYREKMTFQPSFGDVPEGEPVIFNGSSGYMDIGLNKKSFIDEALPQILTAESPLDFYVRIERIQGDTP